MEKPVHELPDRRAMEGVMRGLLGGLVGPREETPLSKTQDLMYEAFESHDPMERVELAKKALELCPDCADAYVLLAEHTKNRKEALEWGRPVGPDHLQPPRQRRRREVSAGRGHGVRLGLPLASRGLSYFGRLLGRLDPHSLEGSQRNRALEGPWRSPGRTRRATSSSRR
jgi:ST7 protein